MIAQYAFDPQDWLVSATRAIASYIAITLDDPDVTVEEDFPDTRSWRHETPLPKSIVHIAQDNLSDTPMGFGRPGIYVTDDVAGTGVLQEAAQHMIDYDVGVWVSAEGGGSTKRMQLVQVLKNMFTVAGNKLAFQDATSGITIVSFEGGNFALDHVNDQPLWRAMGMTLIVKVFSRTDNAPDTLLVDPFFDQSQELSIVGPDGENEPL